ncbi:MAG: FliG C-terminal domain-containing protein [Elusimicrobia bacterium]|nr:FliG C-terminal domain-containing protein [Elusimicrobiota bacterium]
MVKWLSSQMVKWSGSQIVKCLLFLGLIICQFTAIVNAQKEAKTSIETKIALETNLESRLKKVLTEITGTEKLIVIVNVELMSEKKETEPAKKEDDMILPGVPIKETLAEKKVESVMMSALGEDTRTMIKKLSVTVILDKSISPAVVEIVNKVATGLLGIESERGDKLIIQQMSFQKNLFTWSSLIYPPNIYWIIAVLSGLVFTLTILLFLFGPFQKFAKELASAAVNSVAAFKERTSEQSGGFSVGGGVALPELAQSTETKPEKTASGKEPLFSFVNESNVKELIFLLKNESPKHIAAVINYLSPELSTNVLNSISPDKKKDIYSALSKMEEFDSSEIGTIESQLKSRIDYLIGGEEKIMKIIDDADETMQMEILTELRKTNIPLAEKIQKSMIRLDILSTLDITGLQLVIKQIGGSLFGQILKVLSKEAQEKIITMLPAGAATRLRQEMALTKPLAPQRLAIEKKRLLNIIRRMRERGLI